MMATNTKGQQLKNIMIEILVSPRSRKKFNLTGTMTRETLIQKNNELSIPSTTPHMKFEVLLDESLEESQLLSAILLKTRFHFINEIDRRINYL